MAKNTAKKEDYQLTRRIAENLVHIRKKRGIEASTVVRDFNNSLKQSTSKITQNILERWEEAPLNIKTGIPEMRMPMYACQFLLGYYNVSFSELLKPTKEFKALFPLEAG